MLWIHLFRYGYKTVSWKCHPWIHIENQWIHTMDTPFLVWIQSCVLEMSPLDTYRKSVDTYYGYTFLGMDTKLCPGNVTPGYT